MSQPAPRENSESPDNNGESHDSLANLGLTPPLEIRFTLVRNSFQVRAVRAAMKSLAEAHGFDESSTSSLALAVSEGLDNAFDHGCPPGAKVRVDIQLKREGVTIIIEDPGVGGEQHVDIDLENLELDEDSFRGRGLFLIRSYMDRVETTALPDGGTRVVMHKNR